MKRGMYRKPLFLGLLYNNWFLFVPKLYGKNFTWFDENTLYPRIKVQCCVFAVWCSNSNLCSKNWYFEHLPKEEFDSFSMLPVYLALSFVKEGIKIGCNIIVGNSLCVWKQCFVDMWMVAERINLYWTHCRTYTDKAKRTDFVCTVHEPEELYGTIVILITSLWPSESLVCQHDVLQTVTWLSCDNWRVGAKRSDTLVSGDEEGQMQFPCYRVPFSLTLTNSSGIPLTIIDVWMFKQ